MCTWDHTVNYSHVDTICAPRACLPLPPEDIDWEAESVNASMKAGSDVSMNGNLLSQTVETNNIMNFNYDDLHNDELDQPPAPDTVPYVSYPIPDQSIEQPENVTGDIEVEEKGLQIEKEWNGEDKLPLVSMNGNNAIGLMADHPVASTFLPSNVTSQDRDMSTENATLEHLIFGGYFDKPPSPPAEATLVERQGQEFVGTDSDDEEEEASKLVENPKVPTPTENEAHSVSLVSKPSGGRIADVQPLLPQLLPSSILSKAQVSSQKRKLSRETAAVVEKEEVSPLDVTGQSFVMDSKFEHASSDGEKQSVEDGQGAQPKIDKLAEEVSTAVAGESVTQSLDPLKASEISAQSVRDAGGNEEAAMLSATLTITKMHAATVTSSQVARQNQSTANGIVTEDATTSTADTTITPKTTTATTSSTQITTTTAATSATTATTAAATTASTAAATTTTAAAATTATSTTVATTKEIVAAVEGDMSVDVTEVMHLPKRQHGIHKHKDNADSNLFSHT